MIYFVTQTDQKKKQFVYLTEAKKVLTCLPKKPLFILLTINSIFSSIMEIFLIH